MPCRFMDNHGLGNISLAVLCYDWCLEHGAHILSSSFGIYESYGERVLKVYFLGSLSSFLIFLFWLPDVEHFQHVLLSCICTVFHPHFQSCFHSRFCSCVLSARRVSASSIICIVNLVPLL